MAVSFLDLLRCVCTSGTCIEHGKVVWDRTAHTVHIRVDPCLSLPNNVKKPDCLIFYFGPTGRVCALVVEVKSQEYHLEEVRGKLQELIDRLDPLFSQVDPKPYVMPILYAERHKTEVQRYGTAYKVRYRGSPLGIVFLKHGDDALRLARDYVE